MWTVLLGLLGKLLGGAVALLPYLVAYLAGGRGAERAAARATLDIVEKQRDLANRVPLGPDGVLARMRERERLARR